MTTNYQHLHMGYVDDRNKYLYEFLTSMGRSEIIIPFSRNLLPDEREELEKAIKDAVRKVLEGK